MTSFKTLCFSLLALVLFALPQTARAETVKVCYDQWPPMTIFPTEAEPRRGFVIDMLDDIFSQAGYQLDYFEVPYGRGMEMVASGACDLLPEAAYNDAPQAGYVFAGQSTFDYPMAFVLRRDSAWQYDGVASLKPWRVATGPGWDYSSMSVDYQAYLDDPQNKANIEVVAGENDVVNRIFQMIVAQRIDLYADNLLVLKHVMNTTQLGDQLKIVLAGAPYRLVEKPILSKAMPPSRRAALLKVWNTGRQKLSKEAENAYLSRYGLHSMDLD